MLDPVRVATDWILLNLAHLPFCVCFPSLRHTGECKKTWSSYSLSSQWLFGHFLSLPTTAEIHSRPMEKLESQEPVTATESNAGDGSFADSSLLETIDKLFELNVGDYVALPQVGPPTY